MDLLLLPDQNRIFETFLKKNTVKKKSKKKNRKQQQQQQQQFELE